MKASSNQPCPPEPVSRRRFSRRRFFKIATQSAVLLGGLGGYASAEPSWIEVEEISLRLPRLSPLFDGLRVAQISDIHMDEWMTRERLSSIVELVNAQRPDAVLITGDFVTAAAEPHAADLTKALKNLRAPGAFVLGNHDHWTNPLVVRRAASEAGLRDLTNEVWTMRRENQNLHFCGIDDLWAGQGDLPTVLRKTPPQGAAILLCHEPDFADAHADAGRFDLQLSGHSHGGQVRVPFLGAILLPQYGRKYQMGRYQVGAMTLYTNRGVGALPPRLRFNCRPEIAVFTLRASTL